MNKAKGALEKIQTQIEQREDHLKRAQNKLNNDRAAGLTSHLKNDQNAVYNDRRTLNSLRSQRASLVGPLANAQAAYKEVANQITQRDEQIQRLNSKKNKDQSDADSAQAKIANDNNAIVNAQKVANNLKTTVSEKSAAKKEAVDKQTSDQTKLAQRNEQIRRIQTKNAKDNNVLTGANHAAQKL